MSLFTESCTLHLEGEEVGRDDWNEPIYSDPEDHESACWVEPAASSEDLDLANRAIFSYQLYVPLDQPVDRASQVSWDGTRFNVVGEWLKQPGGFVVDGFYRVLIERVEG